MRKNQNRSYSAEERDRAVALGVEKGPTVAARELGIPTGSVSAWMCKAKKVSRRAALTPEEQGASARLNGPGPSAFANGLNHDRPPQPSGSKNRPAKIYSPSERAQALEKAARIGVAATSRELGMSRFSLYEWNRKVRLAASGKIANSPVIGSDEDPRKIRDRRILSEWTKHPGLGPSQVSNQLRRNGIKACVNTVRRVMEENGYTPPKIKRDSSHDQNYEAIRPNQMWHLDFFHRYIHKQAIYVLLIVDDFSRFIVGWVVCDAERGEAVLKTFEESVARHGRPESAMSDGGSAFYAWKGIARFTRFLEELGVDQWIAKTPQVNGKVEVLNANVKKELFNQEMFFDLNQARHRLESWISFYNFRRTHHALGGLLVPADRFFGRADDVLSQIEAGRSPESVGEPLPVNERHLDILKVTTNLGKVTVTLMGQQVWPA